MRISVLGAAITSVVLLVAAARAGEGSGVALPAGEKTITLIANDGARKKIGRVAFTPEGDSSKIDVTLDGADFTDEFLSMRPFRCLAGAKRMWCHLAYPYGTRGLITASDLLDLEYALAVSVAALRPAEHRRVERALFQTCSRARWRNRRRIA